MTTTSEKILHKKLYTAMFICPFMLNIWTLGDFLCEGEGALFYIYYY